MRPERFRAAGAATHFCFGKGPSQWERLQIVGVGSTVPSPALGYSCQWVGRTMKGGSQGVNDANGLFTGLSRLINLGVDMVRTGG